MTIRVATTALMLCACTAEKATIEDPYTGDPAFPSHRSGIITSSGDFGLTSNNGSDSVSVLDIDRGNVLATVPVGRDPVDLDGPHHIAVDWTNRVAFVALAYPAPAVGLGPHAGHGGSQRAGYVQALDLSDLRPVGETRVEANPGDIVLSEDGSRLVVSHFDLLRAQTATTLDTQRADVAVMAVANARTGQVSPTFIRTCVAPHGVALSRPSGDTAFVACYGEDAIAIVDLRDPNAVPQLVKLGPAGIPGTPAYGPYAAVLSPDGARIAVSSTESKDVRIFDVATRTFVGKPMPTPGAPYFAAWSSDSQRLFVPIQNPDALVVLDMTLGKIAITHPFATADCQWPHEVTLGSNSSVYVVCEGDHVHASAILGLNADSLEIGQRYPVGVYPDRLVIGAIQ